MVPGRDEGGQQGDDNFRVMTSPLPFPGNCSKNELFLSESSFRLD